MLLSTLPPVFLKYLPVPAWVQKATGGRGQQNGTKTKTQGLCMETGCAWGQSRLWRRKQPLGTTLSLMETQTLMSKVAAARLRLTGLKGCLMVKIPVETLPERLVWGSLIHRPKATGTVSPHICPRVALCLGEGGGEQGFPGICIFLNQDVLGPPAAACYSCFPFYSCQRAWGWGCQSRESLTQVGGDHKDWGRLGSSVS